MEPPSFSTSGPHILRAAPGSDASLILPLPSGSAPFQFEWSRTGAKLDDRFTRSDDAGGVRLTISAAQTGDSGVYTLQASNAAGKDTTRVRLEVSPDEMPTGEDPPTFLRRVQDLTVKVGTRTRFLVEIVSSTECRVTWYRNERRLLEAERIALVRDGNFWCADIAAVSVDDAGRWTCTAENVGGRASCSAHLNVLVPKAYKRPEFVEELRALLTEQGTVSLECKVVGVPTPVLRWFKDSREIKAGDVFALTANAEDPTSLGTYTCEAVNCMGRAYSSSKVHVVGRASREGSSRPSSGGITPEPPPIFTKELEDNFVRICEPLTLSCNIVVPPWPRNVVWYNKEGKIESNERYRVLEDGVGGYLLEIPNAEWPDEGEWKCVVTSTGGRVGISTCYVSMEVPKNYRKPRFMENLQAVLTEEGLVSFECKVVGFPTPVLSWFKDGQELKPGDVYQLTGTNSLGSYCCIARNCMGQASSSAELTVEDIQNQLNEEEKLQLFSKNQAPKFLQGLKSVEAKIDEPFRFTIKVAIPPEPTVSWYRDDQPIDESLRCHHGKEDRGVSFLDIQNLEFMDQAEWKCVAMNDFGHSVTSCFLKLIIPRHYKKPRFLENLQAILSDEGAVNLECKVIGVPQPVLKWYKDGEELKPGDIHRIISGQDGTCCLGTYTCEAQNCMGIAASSASLLGFEDSMKAKSKKKADEQALQRNLSLSTIHEERTSQMYDTPVGDITLDEKGEISFSFDGKEVSVSLYETPDLTEEEALQIVEMYADQLSENVTEHNVVELPPLRFVKETSTSGNLLMEAIIIDVSPEYFTSPEEDLRTEADIEDISIADENGPPQLSLDQEADNEDYLEKTIALLSDEIADFPKKINRKKSDSQKSVDDYFSLSRDQSLSEEKKDEDTQPLSESDLQSFASARSSGKPKSKSSKPSIEDGQESSDITKTVLLKEDLQKQIEADVLITTPKKQRRRSSSRRSSSGSEKSVNQVKDDTELRKDFENILKNVDVNKENLKAIMNSISTSLTEVMNEIQILERDIILKSEFMSTAATATNSLEIINSLITPLSEIHSIIEVIRETVSESPETITSLLNTLPQSLKNLQDSLTIISKCIDVESDNKTLVKKTCMSIIRNCGDRLQAIVNNISMAMSIECLFDDKMQTSNIETITTDLINIINHNMTILRSEDNKKSEVASTVQEATLEIKHLHATQKAVHELKNSLRSLLYIVEEVDIYEATNFGNIKKSEIILNDMSIPIQDLQTALEQIENLSITESNSDLQKYNTEIIEKAMESVLKLRSSLEQLSAEESNIENQDKLSNIMNEIKLNIKEISIQLDELETKTGKFDILSSDNKLETLQKIAQNLINLENNLPLLESVPSIKDHMTEFHKSLTKVLENVIESNDANKYFALLEICDAVNRMNTSIKGIISNNVLSLASIGNTLKIIHTKISNNVFKSELNVAMLENISNVLIYIQETINKAEELRLDENLEEVKQLSIEKYEENKVNIVLENIEKTMIAISNVISHESSTTKEFSLKKAMESICPILVDLKCCIASLNVKATEKDEKISDLDSLSFSQSIANPLIDLHHNINVLNQVICENADSQEFTLLVEDYAKPLLDLRNTLEILQHDVISQCIENAPYLELNTSIANVVENLKSCIVMIQEQHVIEGADDMSTLEDISGIKTTADILPHDEYITITVNEMENVRFAEAPMPSASDQALQILKENINTLKNSEILTIIDTTEMPEYSCIKLNNFELEEISSQLENILHPITIESCQDSSRFSQIAEIIPPLQEIQQYLSVIDVESIPYCKNITISTPEKTNLMKENIQNLKSNLNDCLDILQSAIELTDSTIGISVKINDLRQLCVNVNSSLGKLEDAILSNKSISTVNAQLKEVVQNVVETLCSSDNLEKVKCAIEDLYAAVVSIEKEITHFVNENPKLSSSAEIFLQVISDIKSNIASLDQCDFVNLSQSLNNNVMEIQHSDDLEEVIDKKNILNSYLTELIAPLDLIRSKFLLDSKQIEEIEKGKPVVSKSVEMQLSYLTNNIEKLDQWLNIENISFNNDDICLSVKLNDTINSIVNCMKGTDISEDLQVFVQPIEALEKLLHRILSLEKVEDVHRSLKEKTEKLLQHVEHYIEIIEIVEEVSAIIKLEDLKESANVVRELQQSIVTSDSASEVAIENDSNNKVKEDQAEIAQKLHKALITLQTQTLESTQELATTANEDVRQQIIDVVSDLQNDFIALTDTKVLLQEEIFETIQTPEIIEEKIERTTQDEKTTDVILEAENETLEIIPNILEEPENNLQVLTDTEQTTQILQSNDQNNEGNENTNVCSEINSSTQLEKDLNVITQFKKSENVDNITSDEKSLPVESELMELYPQAEKLVSIKDILLENIKECISDKTLAVLLKLSHPLHSDHLRKTIELAKQLWNNTISEGSSTEQVEVSSFSTEQIELVLSLNEAVQIMYETTIEESQELEIKIGKDEFQDFKNVISDLRGTLQEILNNTNTIISFNEVENLQQVETHINDPASQAVTRTNEIDNLNELKYKVTDTNVSTNVVGSLENNNDINLETADTSDLKVSTSATDLCSGKSDRIVCKTVDTKDSKELNIDLKTEKPLIKEAIIKHINDFTSEDIVTILHKLSPEITLDNVNQSIQSAHQLYNILSSETENSFFTTDELKCALLLEKAISSIHEIANHKTEESMVLVTNNELNKVNEVMKELQNNLNTIIETMLTDSNVEILDLDDIKVSITQEPFQYKLHICDSHSDIDFLKETTTENFICTTNIEIAVPTEVEATEDLIICEAVSVDVQDQNAEKIKEQTLKSISSVNDKDVILPNVQEELRLKDFNENVDTISNLEKLLKEVNDMIDLTSGNNLEPLQNSLDEVQTVIMELKSDFNGTVSDGMNETLEDLEWNVRSVQLQINEYSPPALLREACANLQVLVAHLSDINEVESVLSSPKNKITEDILGVCSNDVSQTIDLIEIVSGSENAHKLEHVISNLNKIKDTIKSLRINYLTNAESLIMGGIEIIQNLNQIEDQIFSLEKDLESEKNIDVITRDSILSAIHSIYGSISNMRGTVSSVQKKYMYENYGEPSRYLLVSIKNVMICLKINENPIWKEFAKSLRKVLNHFEDVKFYINFDKTARLPSDAAFTKIILGELHSVLSGDVLQIVSNLDEELSKRTCSVINLVNKTLEDIAQMTTLEVKEKIPIFKNLAIQMLDLTENIKLFIENEIKNGRNNIIDVNLSLKDLTTIKQGEGKVDEKVLEKIVQSSDNVEKTQNIELIDMSTSPELLSKTNEKEIQKILVTEADIEEKLSPVEDGIKEEKYIQQNNDAEIEYKEIQSGELQSMSLKLAAENTTEDIKILDIPSEQERCEDFNKDEHLTVGADNIIEAEEKVESSVMINKNENKIEQEPDLDNIHDIVQKSDKNEQLQLRQSLEIIDSQSTPSDIVDDDLRQKTKQGEIIMDDRSKKDEEITESENVFIKTYENKPENEECSLQEKEKNGDLLPNVVGTEEIDESVKTKDEGYKNENATVFLKDAKQEKEGQAETTQNITEPIANKLEESINSHLIVKDNEVNTSITTHKLLTEKSSGKINEDSNIKIYENKNVESQNEIIDDFKTLDNKNSIIELNVVSEPINEEIITDIKVNEVIFDEQKYQTNKPFEIDMEIGTSSESTDMSTMIQSQSVLVSEEDITLKADQDVHKEMLKKFSSDEKEITNQEKIIPVATKENIEDINIYESSTQEHNFTGNKALEKATVCADAKENNNVTNILKTEDRKEENLQEEIKIEHDIQVFKEDQEFINKNESIMQQSSDINTIELEPKQEDQNIQLSLNIEESNKNDIEFPNPIYIEEQPNQPKQIKGDIQIHHSKRGEDTNENKENILKIKGIHNETAEEITKVIENQKCEEDNVKITEKDGGKQDNKNEENEMKLDNEMKSTNLILIQEEIKDIQKPKDIQKYIATSDSFNSDKHIGDIAKKEKNITDLTNEIKIETINSIDEIDQVTSPLNISLETKENIGISIVEKSLNDIKTDLISVEEHVIQTASANEDETKMKTTNETGPNTTNLSDEICEKLETTKVSDKYYEHSELEKSIIDNIKENIDHVNLKMSKPSNENENLLEYSTSNVANIYSEHSNRIESLNDMLQPENKQVCEENSFKSRDENMNLNLKICQGDSDLNDKEQQEQNVQNVNNEIEKTINANKTIDIHENQRDECQLKKVVTEQLENVQETILNVEENKMVICSNLDLEMSMKKDEDTDLELKKNMENIIDQNLKENPNLEKDDVMNNKIEHGDDEKLVKDEDNNKSVDIECINNILSISENENETKTLEQHEYNDNENKTKCSIKEENAQIKSSEKYVLSKEKETNTVILDPSKEHTKQKESVEQESQMQIHVEAITKEENNVSSNDQKQESPNKQPKVKKRSKKSRETPKPTTEDDVKSHESEHEKLDNGNETKLDKPDKSCKLQDSHPENFEIILIEKDKEQQEEKPNSKTSKNESKSDDIGRDKSETEKYIVQIDKNDAHSLVGEDISTTDNSQVQDISEQLDEVNKDTICILTDDSRQKQNINNLKIEELKGSRQLKDIKLSGTTKELSIASQEIDDNGALEQRKIYPVIKEYSDYTSEFSRPPGYISKPFSLEETASQVQINAKDHLKTIYKAQTLIHESQLRSSMLSHMDQNLSIEVSRNKERTKAVSECRSILSDKRTSSARDTKRKPVFSTFLTDRTAVEGSRVKLTCSILSPNDPTITWYKNGKELDNKHKFRSKFVEGLITFEILNAVPSDSGEYSCSIQNENGSITSSANLKVYPSFEASPIPPTFTRSIRDNYHLAENELVLECRIRGQPLPTITWFKDDKPIALSDRYQAHYLADGVCRLTISSPINEDSGKYTCKAENSMWSDQISHDVYFTGKTSRLSPSLATVEKLHFNRQALESRRPHFTNVLSDHKVVTGGTIGLQVEIRGSPIRVEWLREGHSVTEMYRNAQTYVDHGIYTLALNDVTEKESGLYTCRAYSTQGNVDMNASITVIQPNQYDGKPARIVSRPEKDVLISIGEDLNISFRVQGEPKAKVFFMKGIRDITNTQRVCKMTSDDYVKFTLKRTVISDAGTYCIFARNAYGCDRAFVTVVIRQRASSDSLISDWTYPMDDLAIASIDRSYKSVPNRIPSEPSAVDGGSNWVSLAWPKPDPQSRAPILAYKVESWLLGKEGGARWVELGITPRNSFDAFNLKQGEEYHFRVTPRNRYGWGESVQTSVPMGIGLTGDRPEFIDILPGQLKVLVGETAILRCSFKGKPIPEIVWMKNGHEIEEEVGKVTIEINNFNTSLRIEEVKSDDEGRYSCEATNIHGRSSTYARMAVITDRQIWQADAKLKRERSAGVDGEYPPQFTMRLRDRRVQATYPVRLTCQVVGNPTPKLKWFKNEEEVFSDDRHTTSQDEYFYTLEIAPTTLEDGGVYEAMARNGCGAVSCRCSLVVDKGIRAYIAPEFCCGLEPLYHLSEGDELRISAIVEAYPSVGVTWYRDGVRLRPSRRAIMTLDRDGQIELALASVTNRDAGVYTCTASNEVGMASTSGKVEIVSGEHVGESTSAPPIVITSDMPYSKEPMFIKKPRSSEAREGDTVIIECEVIGDPKPDVYWLRDFLKPDYYRDSSHFKRVGAGPAYRFEIPHAKLDYTGAYSIVAKNVHGETKAIISLQILAKDLTCGEDVHNIRFGRVDVIPRFEKELTDLLCYDGDAIEFECSVTGNPEPDIRWFRYKEIIPECADFESSYEIGIARLKIKQVTAEDEGTYTCEASNSLGKSSTSACLVVYPPGEPNTLSQRLRRPPALLSAASTPRSTPRTTPARSLSRTPGPDPRRLCSPSREIAPKFYTYPYNRVAEEGDTIVFQCAVKGLPPPWATWDKDGIIITPSARISVKEKDDMFRILEIENVTIEDVGLYRISLENDYGRAEASARLEVITQKGKFYGSTRSYSVSPRKTLSYRRRTPSFSKQD